jgi:hypothetical protein
MPAVLGERRYEQGQRVLLHHLPDRAAGRLRHRRSGRRVARSTAGHRGRRGHLPRVGHPHPCRGSRPAWPPPALAHGQASPPRSGTASTWSSPTGGYEHWWVWAGSPGSPFTRRPGRTVRGTPRGRAGGSRAPPRCRPRRHHRRRLPARPQLVWRTAPSALARATRGSHQPAAARIPHTARPAGRHPAPGDLRDVANAIGRRAHGAMIAATASGSTATGSPPSLPASMSRASAAASMSSVIRCAPSAVTRLESWLRLVTRARLPGCPAAAVGPARRPARCPTRSAPADHPARCGTCPPERPGWRDTLRRDVERLKHRPDSLRRARNCTTRACPRRLTYSCPGVAICRHPS